MHGRNRRPRRGSLEGLDQAALVEEHIAQVRAAEAVPSPRLPDGAGQGHRAVPAQHRMSGRPPGTHGLRASPLPADDRQCAVVDSARPQVATRDRPCATLGKGGHDGRGCLLHIRQPHHVGGDPGLDQLPERRAPRLKGVEEEALVALHGRRGAHAKRELGDHAEGPLAAEDHLAQIRARGTRGPAPGGPRATRCRHHDLLDHRVTAAVPRRGLTGGPRCGVPPERGPLPALREVAEGQSARTEQPLEDGPGDARTDPNSAGDLVDGDEVGHPVHRHAHHTGPARTIRTERTDHGSAAAERHDGETLALAHLQQREGVRVRAGADDGARGMPGAEAAVDEVEVAHPAAVAEPVGPLCADMLSTHGLREGCEMARRERGLLGRRLHHGPRNRLADVLDEEGAGPVRQVRRVLRQPPAQECPAQVDGRGHETAALHMTG